MSQPVRVRFAVSPTGSLHLGGIRSALFNYLIARHTGGSFLLRIEDTDRERLVEGAAEAIWQSLAWLGIDPDEGVMSDGSQKGGDGPYVQSERLDIYHKYADELLAKKSLYPCWCTPERLDGLRKDAQKAGQAFKYDRYCLEHPKDLSEPHVLRFFIPASPETISWDDLVKGGVSFKTDDLDDFVAVKSDGYPTYHFAVVVDDHLMKISHVLRGDEWVPSTPKHLLLYAAFGWEPTVFVHLPQVLGTDKTKLSKRHGAKPALEYRDEGYLPEAVVNFLAALGWNDGTTQEIYSHDELVKAFTLERIQKSPAVFDSEHLLWMNGLYIRQMASEKLLERCEDFWPDEAADYAPDYRLSVLKLVQERLKFLGELAELTVFFFADPTVDLSLAKGYTPEEARCHLSALTDLLAQTEWSHNDLETALRGYVEREDLHTGHLFGLIRVVLTGRTAAPGLFETMLVLGQETTLRRLVSASNPIN
jgi:glutamyl-tRNA synthetase